MKRMLIGLGVAALSVLGLAAPATAGGTRTDVDVTRGFAFAIDAVGLTSARIPGGPVTTIRTSSISRDASATGHVGTVRLRASDLGSALLSKTVVTKR